MADSIAGPVSANVPVYRHVPPDQRKRKQGNEKEVLGTANAMVGVYLYDTQIKTEEGYKNRLLCQVTVTVRNKEGNLADQVEELFDLDDDRAAAPFIKASTIFPTNCGLYTLIIRRPADPNNIKFLK